MGRKKAREAFLAVAQGPLLRLLPDPGCEESGFSWLHRELGLCADIMDKVCVELMEYYAVEYKV